MLHTSSPKRLLAALCVLLPLASSVASAQSLLVSSRDDARIYRFDGQTGAYSGAFIVGNGITSPTGFAYGSDNKVYVSDYDTNRVQRFDGNTGAYLGNFVPNGDHGLRQPYDLRFSPDGATLFVASFASSGGTPAVFKYDRQTGAFLGHLGLGVLQRPAGLAFGPDGKLYVSDAQLDKVFRFTLPNGSAQEFVPAGSNGLDDPRGLVFGADGNLYVSDNNKDRVQRYNGTTGASMGVFANGSNGKADEPIGVVFGPDANLYVANASVGNVARFKGTTGAYIDNFVPGGTGGIRQAEFLLFVTDLCAISSRVTTLGNPCAATLSISSAQLGTNAGVDVYGAAGDAVGALFYSAPGAAPTLVFGCQVFLDLSSTTLYKTFKTDGGGRYRSDIPIPYDPILRCGDQFVLQAAVLSSVTPFHVDITNGVLMTLGS